jgi:mitogen-activated protein kinase 7
MFNVLGSPNAEYLPRLSRRWREYVRSFPFTPKRTFPSLFPNASPDAVDLLDQMLAFDPSSRISVEAALGHPYLHFWHDASDEPSCPTPFDNGFKNEDYEPKFTRQTDVIRKMFLEEVTRFRQLVHKQPSQEQHTQGEEQQAGTTPIPQGGSKSAEDPQPQKAYG